MKTTSSGGTDLPPPANRDGVLAQLLACQPAHGHGVDLAPVVPPGLQRGELGDRQVEQDINRRAEFAEAVERRQGPQGDEVPATVQEATLQRVADHNERRRVLLLAPSPSLTAHLLHP